MSIIETIVFFVTGGFAGYGLSAYLEDERNKREARRKRIYSIIRKAKNELDDLFPNLDRY